MWLQGWLWCPENDVHMAVIGGQVAREYNISREMQDRWAARSQEKWALAEKNVFLMKKDFQLR